MHQPSVPQKSRTHWWLVLLLVFFSGFFVKPWVDEILSRRNAAPRPITPRGDLSAKEKSTVELFSQTSPSVVYITTLSKGFDPWSRNAFQIPRGTGSGIIWDAFGHVVTNFHVIAGAQAAQVRLEDQRTFNASLVGASPEHDLAVLHIDIALNPPPPVLIGDSRDLLVGQDVFAIGTPFGLDRTLTTGIISALNRTLSEENGQVINHLIQTDAAINPGNSGGPLMDSAGRLIGINTAIFSPSGANSGIGFAIPVDSVNRVVPQLIKLGRYQRPALGITVDDRMSTFAARDMGIDGVLILGVEPDSAAARAGLRGSQVVGPNGMVPGDFIIAIDNQPVKNLHDILDLLDQHQSGDTIDLRIKRNNETLNVSVTLGAANRLSSLTNSSKINLRNV